MHDKSHRHVSGRNHRDELQRTRVGYAPPKLQHVFDGMPLLPQTLPERVHIEELLHRASRKYDLDLVADRRKLLELVEKHYVPASPRVWVARSHLRDKGLVRHGQAHHPRHVGFAVDPVSRILAQLEEHPQWIADSWSAAALFGVKEFSCAADTCVATPGNFSLSREAKFPTRRRIPRDGRLTPAVWMLYTPAGQPIKSVNPPEALVQCLISVSKGYHAWKAPAIQNLSNVDVCCVQVIDQFRRHLGVTVEQLADRARGVYKQRLVQKYFALSTGSADSPPETTLRLIALPLARRLGITLTTQVEVFNDDGSLLTRLDLGHVGLLIAVFYDGDHHRTRTQQRKDAGIDAELARRGWSVLRVTSRQLNDPQQLETMLLDLFRRAFAMRRAFPGAYEFPRIA